MTCKNLPIFVLNLFGQDCWRKTIWEAGLSSVLTVFKCCRRQLKIWSESRSSHQRCSIKQGVLKDFAKLTGKHVCQNLKPAILLKKTLWHRCFPVNFVKFLRIHRRETASKNHQKMPYERICLHWSCRFRSFNTTKSELFCVYFSEFFPLFRNTYFKERIFKDCFHNLFLQSISSVL